MSDPRENAPTAKPWRSYKERLAVLSQRLVEAQRPIQVLNAIRWPASVLERFRESRWRTAPDPIDYQGVPLGFDFDAKHAELKDIEACVAREFGQDDAVANILMASTVQYRQIVDMLKARGTRTFHELSRTLYGSSKDFFSDGTTRVRDIAFDMYEILTQLDDVELGPQPPRDIPAEQAVQILNERLDELFGQSVVRVILDDGIVADAAAGSDYVKLRRGAMFSLRDIRVLEVHEGWVHVATSLNGQQQPVARWLAKGPPRTAATQEGLAALLEVLTFTSHPNRARRLNDRVLAVDKAEDGASFMDIFEWFRTEGYDPETCYWNTQRVFRGGTLDGGAPFTKDIVYTKGIVANYNFIQSAIKGGRPELIRWLFVGKVALEDIPVLARRVHEGVVRPPLHIPAIFKDLNGLAIWLGVSSFWGRLNNRAIHQHYAKLFARG